MTAEAASRALPSASFEVSANVTRGAPERAIQIDPGASAVVIDKRDGHPGAPYRPTPEHPARRATDLTAGLLARGSPPVTAFPGFSQWHCGTSSPLTVAGAAAELGR